MVTLLDTFMSEKMGEQNASDSVLAVLNCIDNWLKIGIQYEFLSLFTLVPGAALYFRAFS